MLLTTFISLICGLLGTAIWQLIVKVYKSFPSTVKQTRQKIKLFNEYWEDHYKTVSEDDELINYHRYEGLKGLIFAIFLIIVQAFILYVFNPWILLLINKKIIATIISAPLPAYIGVVLGDTARHYRIAERAFQIRRQLKK
jgi:hypothetical protein